MDNEKTPKNTKLFLIKLTMKKGIVLIFLLVFLSSCSEELNMQIKNAKIAASTVKNNWIKNHVENWDYVLFQSDFENKNLSIPIDEIEVIISPDTESNLSQYMGTMYEWWDINDRYSRIIEDPSDNNNSILQFWLKNSKIPNPPWWNLKWRIQSILVPRKTLPENKITNFKQTHRMYLHSDLELYKTYPEENSWFVIHELVAWASWEWDKYPFLMGLGIAKAKWT